MTTTTFATSRFGDIEFSTDDVITFVHGLVGLPDLQQYILIQHKENSPFRWMQSLDDGNIAFLVVDPGAYVSDYAPEMPVSAAETLQLSDETPYLVYTIANIPSGKPREMTLNLAGPIVINAESRQALQIVLEEDRFPIRFRAFSEAQAA
jgi:flagellar assembly factor FliW